MDASSCAPSSTARVATARDSRAHRARGRRQVRRRPGARAEGRSVPGPAREPRASSGAGAGQERAQPLRLYGRLLAARGEVQGASHTDTVDVARPQSKPRGATSSSTACRQTHAGFYAEDAFEFLEDASKRGDTWDIVISDPPSFAPRQDALPRPEPPTPGCTGWRRSSRRRAVCYAPRPAAATLDGTSSCRRSRRRSGRRTSLAPRSDARRRLRPPNAGGVSRGRLPEVRSGARRLIASDAPPARRRS